MLTYRHFVQPAQLFGDFDESVLLGYGYAPVVYLAFFPGFQPEFRLSKFIGVSFNNFSIDF